MKNMNKIMLTGFMMTTFYTSIQGSQNQVQPLMGANSNTWAPQVFTPADAYSGDGMIGNYFASSEVAVIHNPNFTPSIAMEKSYAFSDVEVGGVEAPAGKTLIGSYGKPKQKPKPGQAQHFGTMIINLYGVEQK